MNNINPIFGEILSGFTSQSDRLTKLEKRRGNLDDLYADCTSVLGDFECAMNLLDSMAGDDNDMAEAYSLMEKAWALVSRKRDMIESGDHE